MRKAALVVGLVFCFSLFAGFAQAAEKYGYVDLGKLFSEYGKTKDYDKVLESKESVFTSEREKKLGELKKLQETMNLTNEKEKQTKQGDLETKVKSFQDFDRQKQLDLRKEQDEKLKEIMKDIEDAVKTYAEKEAYTYIFDDRVLIYKVKGTDVTDKILEQLNKTYTPSAGKK